jgi:hypothetical protein
MPISPVLQTDTGTVARGKINDAITQANLVGDKADDNAVVKLTGNQTVGGIKTLTSIPVLPASNPTTDNQASRKAYVDGLDTANVKLTGNQTVAGIKTFSSIPVAPASNPTTDNQLARKAYVDTKAVLSDTYPFLNAKAPVQGLRVVANNGISGSSGIILGTTDFSILLPINITGTDTETRSHFRAADAATNTVYIGIQQTSTTVASLRIVFYGPSGVVLATSLFFTTAIPKGTHNSLVVTFARSGVATAYINGLAFGSVSISAASAVDISNTTGYRFFKDGNLINGEMREAIIWNYALPATTTSGVKGIAERFRDGDWVTPYDITNTTVILHLAPELMQPAPGQCLDASPNKRHALQSATGTSLVRPKREGRIYGYASSDGTFWITGTDRVTLPIGARITAVTVKVIGTGGDVSLWDGTTRRLCAVQAVTGNRTNALTIDNPAAFCSSGKLRINHEDNIEAYWRVDYVDAEAEFN